MNTTNYKQYDTRWSGLPYKDLPDNIGNNGCGMVAINNGIIEMLSQMDQTPITMQPHCRQYACHDGTYWSAIPKMLEFYGCTEVMEHDNMSSLWRELEKGDRIAIYMMNKYPGGSKQVHWTSGGHFIVSCGFRYENGLHKLYVKDSNSTSSDRNYWISYEENMRGDVSACWSGKLNGSPSPTPTPTPPGKIAVDGVGGYETVYRLQQFLNLSDPDGLIGHQRSARKKYYPALTAVSFSLWGSSNTVTALQQFLNLPDPDGIIGPNTAGALQRRLRDLGYLAASEEIDNIIGAKTMRALQTALNNDFKKVTPPTPPTPTPGGDTKMIDVSEFQGSIDWGKVKADGIKAVIIRVGGRGGEKGNIYDDTRFFENMRGAYNAGLSVGIYFLTQAISAAEGKEEAEYTIRKWTESGIPISFPICIDSEDVSWKNPDGSIGYGRAHSRKLSQARRTMAIQGFAEECKRQGFASMIYASTNWLYNQVDMNVLGPIMDIWVAQWSSSCDYRGKYIIWQYSNAGSVNGIKGNVDMDKCYVDPKKVDPPKPEPGPTPTPGGHYTGKYPEVRVKRSIAEVLQYAIKWAIWIAANNDFHYGYGPHAHHNGCYFCGTQAAKMGHGIKMPEHTYCCNPFVHAALAHGGLIPKALKMCSEGRSWDFNKGSGYDACDMFDKLGKPAQSKLKPGDVLCNGGHVVLYIGDGKIAEASGGDDNVIHSKGWNNSIHVTSLDYSDFDRVYRLNTPVDADIIMRKGEVSERVADLQRYLVWYGALPQGEDIDIYYGEKTFKAVVKMQTDFFGASEADGTIGPKTITKMKEYSKGGPTPTPGGHYTGSLPTMEEIKAASNQGAINRAVNWTKDIARQGFGYLWPQQAACYFCGSTSKKAYTCMPFITAAYAHGGGDPDVLALCKNRHALGLHEDDPDWQTLIRKGKFAYLGRMSGIDWSAIKVGDVLVQYASDDQHGHMMMYAGNNQLAEASPDVGCAITGNAKGRYTRYANGESQCGQGSKNFVMRYVGTRAYISKGDSGTAVLEWQDFLDWWSDGQFYKECRKGDGVFGANTHKWTVAFQEKEMGKGQGDGTVGPKTISAAQSIRK